MSVNIHIVTPIIPTGLTKASDFIGILSPEDHLTYTEIEHGPETIDSEFDEMIAAPATVAEVVSAAAAGADAVVIDCMGDPGLRPARECVNIPVLGPGETSMHIACLLGHRYSVVTMREGLAHQYESQARVYGAWEKYGSTRAINTPVMDLGKDREQTLTQLIDAARAAIQTDGSDVIILGCTGMVGFALELQVALEQQGIPAPVVDPLPVTVRIAKALALSGLSHSKLIFQPPLSKKRRGYTECGAMGIRKYEE